ncbi:ABC transporter permease [Sinomicrobium weinanense]|uniref:ABC transporter permease n=1 Tax=Sinomicrobium weinanense TaxID=2842200 RepID=A0A926JP70_9FLAO|nr:ABC transporter permease [Sinomicrobium weinanense]MBC9794763.1 ABC transporter permease [Sinomicrobium weinanense]MBU3125022.1 ABC transporter permease [Sinomicrobium weinanense]
MIRNYFKTAWKTLKKNKFFSFINIFGLTIGTSCFLLIALYIFDELTFDRFHQHTSNIYRAVNHKTNSDGKLTKIAGTGYQVSENARTDLPEIQGIARMITLGRTNVSASDHTQVFHEYITLGNPDFFDIFDFEFLQGTPANALTGPHTVVMTEEMAHRLFGTTDVLGKTIRTDMDDIPVEITGVLKDFPGNSSITFNMLFSESSMTGDGFKNFINTDWDSDAFATYFLLKDQSDPKKVEADITRLIAENRDTSVPGKIELALQPLADIHFHSENIEGDSGKKGSLTTIYVFSIVAFFVLFIACINYINLTTARYTNRAKEIAVRKVAGASRQNLTGQFLTEAFLTTVIAIVFALIITKIVLPWFNTFTEKQLTLGTATDYRILMGIGLITIAVGLLSGLYPALVQAALKPLSLIKHKDQMSKGKVSLRRSLVVLQFVVSIVMIVATMVIYLQMKYINNKDMGFRKDQLVVVDINSGEVRDSWKTIRNEFSKLAQVTRVSVSSRVPGEWKNLPSVSVHNNAGDSRGKDMFFLGVDDQFLQTYDIKLLQGRNFLPDHSADSTSVLINESAARALGIVEPSGQLIEIPSVNFGGDFSPLDKPFLARVVGIVRDFNFQSLREPLAPMVLGARNNPVHSIDYFTVRLSRGDTDVLPTLKKMQEIFYEIDQGHQLEYHFLDEQWELFYRNDRIRETIFIIMTLLAILIACLGLLGLSTYAAEQRIKEIGIRKVLGASTGGIVSLLSKDFIKPVLIAILIASPIAWWGMNSWLEGFAYRINIQWWVFALAGLVAVAIALITVSGQSIKAATANPVKSLRTE